MEQIGVYSSTNIFKSDESFLQVIQKINNCLQSRHEDITPEDLDLFMQVTRQNARELQIEGDVVIIHDIQPLALIQMKTKPEKKWLWQCQVDVSQADETIWKFLSPFIHRYDTAVFTAPSFSRSLPIRQYLIAPSIDPLSDRNRELSPEEIDAVFSKYCIPRDRPIIIQVFRIEEPADPVGIVRAFEIVRKSIDSRLLLVFETSTDELKSAGLMEDIYKKLRETPEVHVLAIPPDNDLDINALQRGASIILHKSLTEDSGEKVIESLWKARPVVASAAGSIPDLVKNNLTGLLSHGIEGTAQALRLLLSDPEYAASLGNNGREHVKNNYLITNHLKNFLMLLLAIEHNEAEFSLPATVPWHS